MFNNKYINKNIVFFIRHENDLDFILPLILKTRKRKIVFWRKINKNDPRIKYLLKINKEDVIFLSYFQRHITVDIFLYFLNHLSNILSNNIKKIFQFIEVNSLLKCLKKNKNLLLFSEFDLIAFDHIYNDFVESIILFSKSINKNIKSISLPHGTNPFINNITNKNLISFHRINLKKFDKVFCSDKQHFEIIENNNKVIIYPMRFTKLYVNFFIDEILSIKSKKNENDNENLNILYLHSKIFGNINSDEIKRMFKIFNKYKNFNIVIKKHPRGGYRELKKLFNIKNYLISEKHPIELMLINNYIICVQSISIIDALILNKIVIVPTYFSSNIFDPSILKYCLVINSPDELLINLEKISKKNLQNINAKFKTKDFEQIFDIWKKELESI